MIEVRAHGRGGQGSVTFAEIVSVAAFADGRQTQAFAAFGPERRGAPVAAFVRINDKPIRMRQQVYNPDVVVVFDPCLIEVVDVLAGMKKGGIVVINTEAPLRLNGDFKYFNVNADKIALETIGKPIVNTAMLGAFAKATGLVTLGSLKAAISQRFGEKAGEQNFRAAERAYNETVAV